MQPGPVCLRYGSHRQALASHSVSPELVPPREGLVSNQRHVHQLWDFSWAPAGPVSCEAGGQGPSTHVGFSFVLPAWAGRGGPEGTSSPWCPGPVGGHSLCPATSMKAQLGRGRPSGRRHHSPDRPSVSVYCPMLSHGATVGTRQQGPASPLSVINESSGVCQSTSVQPPFMTTGPEAVLEGTHRLQPVSHFSAEG